MDSSWGDATWEGWDQPMEGDHSHCTIWLKKSSAFSVCLRWDSCYHLKWDFTKSQNFID